MALPGNAASFLIGANTVAELTSVTNTITGEELDTTTFDDGIFRTFIAGLVNGQMSISGYYDPTDTNGQVALRSAILGGTLISTPKFLVDGTNGFSAVNGLITSIDIGAEVAGLVTFAATIRLSGTISVVS